MDTTSETKWAKLALRFLPPGGTSIFKGNISSKDIICSKLCNNGFWKDVLLTWANLSYKENINVVGADKQQIWYNSNVRVQNKIVFFNAWYHAGIITIGDLMDPKGKIMSYDQFSANYRVRSNFVQYNSIISAIPFTWKKVQMVTSMVTSPILDNLCNAVKPSKYAYNTFISQSAQFPNHLIEK